MSRKALVQATPSAPSTTIQPSDGEGRPVCEQVVASTAVRAVERVEGQVLIDAFTSSSVNGRAGALDEEEPDERADSAATWLCTTEPIATPISSQRTTPRSVFPARSATSESTSWRSPPSIDTRPTRP